MSTPERHVIAEHTVVGIPEDFWRLSDEARTRIVMKAWKDGRMVALGSKTYEMVPEKVEG